MKAVEKDGKIKYVEDDRFEGVSKDVKKLLRYRSKTINQLEAQWAQKCSECNFIKPIRTYHCSVCNQCVLLMDHHCCEFPTRLSCSVDQQLRGPGELSLLLVVRALHVGGSRIQPDHHLRYLEPPRVPPERAFDERHNGSRLRPLVRHVRGCRLELVPRDERVVIGRDLVKQNEGKLRESMCRAGFRGTTTTSGA